MKKAFTLVELIVVITILAVLGTISFISLQGYSKDARDTKRVSDVRSLLSKVNIENAKGVSLLNMTSPYYLGETDEKINNLIINGTGAIGYQGKVDFESLKEDEESFLDPKSKENYPFAFFSDYVDVGGKRKKYTFMQFAYESESTSNIRLLGNYYKMDSSDSPSLFTNKDGNPVEDGGDIGNLIETGRTRIYNCVGLPEENMVWTYTNTKTQQITQYTNDDGLTWLPLDSTLVASYGVTKDAEKCYYKCAVNFDYNLATKKCVPAGKCGTTTYSIYGDNNSSNLQAIESLETNTLCDVGNVADIDEGISLYRWKCIGERSTAKCWAPKKGNSEFSHCTEASRTVINHPTYNSNGDCSLNDFVVCSGENEGFIISACDIGSSVSGQSSIENYGNFYQWGSNEPSYVGQQTHTRARDDWGGDTNTNLAMQGPCPNGYHIPSKGEIGRMGTAWGVGFGGFPNALKMPYAGIMDVVSGNITYIGELDYHWYSTFSGRHYMYTNGTTYPSSACESKVCAFPIRCIKN